MSDWAIYPWNVSGILTAWVLLVFVLYLLTIRQKSAVTWTLIMFLVAGIAGSVVGDLINISGNSGWEGWVFESSVLDPLLWLFSTANTVLGVALFYKIGPVRFIKEERLVLRLLVAVGALLLLVRIFWHTDGTPIYFGVFGGVCWVWNAVLLIRKWIRSGSAQNGARSMYGAFLGFIVFILLAGVAGQVLVSMGAVQTGEIFREILGPIGVIVPILLFMQFIPETTSLEAKFVAGGFLAVIVLTQLETAPVNSSYELRSRYAPNLEPETIDLIPTEDGGYRAEGRPHIFHTPGGDTLGTADDFTKALKTEFPVFVYGQERDSVYITANGKAHFEPRTDGRSGYQRMLDLDVPTIAAFDIDLNPSSAGPGPAIVYAEPGAVLGFSTNDSLVVTWHEIPEFWDFNRGIFTSDKRLMSAQFILRRDGTMSITRGETSFRPTRWARGISPGLDVISESGYAPDSTDWFGARGRLVTSHLPVSATATEPLYYEERNTRHYREWARVETFRLLRNAFIGFLLILVIVPAYYRFSVRRRMRRLMRGVADVNAGKLDQDVPVTINDEIGQLSSAFNEMTGSLRQYTDRMEDLVDERTAELRATQSQLIEQEKLASLGSLTAGIAHEIKNPLNFVNNFAEVSSELAVELRDAVESGDAEAARAIVADLLQNTDQIAKHGKRADSIVRSMMQHARGGSARKETVGVNEFVGEYIDLAWHGMRARNDGFNADVEKEFDPNAGEMTVQSQEIGRVLVNLLNNAFQVLSSDDGPEKGLVRVTTRRKGAIVEIIVADNGPGIPREIRSRIFEPFFTTKPTGEGTGLGLSLSYDIVTKGHGGEMTVENAPGGGARFTVRLPAE